MKNGKMGSRIMRNWGKLAQVGKKFLGLVGTAHSFLVIKSDKYICNELKYDDPDTIDIERKACQLEFPEGKYRAEARIRMLKSIDNIILEALTSSLLTAVCIGASAASGGILSVGCGVAAAAGGAAFAMAYKDSSSGQAMDNFIVKWAKYLPEYYAKNAMYEATKENIDDFYYRNKEITLCKRYNRGKWAKTPSKGTRGCLGVDKAITECKKKYSFGASEKDKFAASVDNCYFKELRDNKECDCKKYSSQAKADAEMAKAVGSKTDYCKKPCIAGQTLILYDCSTKHVKNGEPKDNPQVMSGTQCKNFNRDLYEKLREEESSQRKDTDRWDCIQECSGARDCNYKYKHGTWGSFTAREHCKFHNAERLWNAHRRKDGKFWDMLGKIAKQ